MFKNNLGRIVHTGDAKTVVKFLFTDLMADQEINLYERISRCLDFDRTIEELSRSPEINSLISEARERLIKVKEIMLDHIQNATTHVVVDDDGKMNNFSDTIDPFSMDTNDLCLHCTESSGNCSLNHSLPSLQDALIPKDEPSTPKVMDNATEPVGDEEVRFVCVSRKEVASNTHILPSIQDRILMHIFLERFYKHEAFYE
ncbi:hypothetical protein ACOME3_008948 [Neoechinorhynchus agilis]